MLGSKNTGDVSATGFGKFAQAANDATQPDWLSVFAGTSFVIDDTGQAEAITDTTSKRFASSTRVFIMGGEFKLVGNNAGADGYNILSTTASTGSFTFIGNPTLTVSQPAGGTQTVMQLNHARPANGFTFLGLRATIWDAGRRTRQRDHRHGRANPCRRWRHGCEHFNRPVGLRRHLRKRRRRRLGYLWCYRICPLTSAQYDATFTGSLPGSASAENFKITSDQNPVADSSVNGLVVINANLNLGTTKLTVTSGALLMAAGTPTSINGGTLDFGSAEGIIHTGTGHDTTISSTITGSGGLTKSGPAALILGANNTFSGTVSLNGGTLIADRDTELGASSNVINMASGVLQPTAAYTSTARNVTMNSKSGGFDIEGTQNFTITGTISGGTTYSPLVKTGSGTLVLSPATSNSWVGGTIIKGGTLRVAADSALNSTGVAAGNNFGTAT